MRLASTDAGRGDGFMQEPPLRQYGTFISFGERVTDKRFAVRTSLPVKSRRIRIGDGDDHDGNGDMPRFATPILST